MMKNVFQVRTFKNRINVINILLPNFRRVQCCRYCSMFVSLQKCSHWRWWDNGIIWCHSLYTNIPIIDKLSIIKDYVNNDDQFTRKMVIPQGKFLDLVHLVLTTTWYTINSQFYQQTDGVTIGGPASSTKVEIYMYAYERTAISTALHSLKIWQRFVDDVYSIFKTYALGKLFPLY